MKLPNLKLNFKVQQLREILGKVASRLPSRLAALRQINTLKLRQSLSGSGKTLSRKLAALRQINVTELRQSLSGSGKRLIVQLGTLPRISASWLASAAIVLTRNVATVLYRLWQYLRYYAAVVIRFFADEQSASRDPLRDYIRETRLFTDRIRIASFSTLLLMAAIVGRLIYLQIINQEHYVTLSQNNRISIVALPPPRGTIYDRNGLILAQNIASFSLSIVPEQVENLDATITELQKIITITDEDIKRFHKALRQKRTSNGIPLRSRLSDEEVARFAIDRSRFTGVDVDASLARHYPLGSLGVHTIGYVGRINEKELGELKDPADYNGTTHIGKTGVEKSYEEMLHGSAGFEQVEINSQGRRLRVLDRTPPKAGQDLYLNIDVRLQSLAESVLGENRGAIIALDPKTGAILALASMPGYDPNPFVNGIASGAYDLLAKSPDQPLYNRALRGQYPPGSTVKPFVGLGSLELGIINPNKTYYCPGFFRLGGKGRQYRDWKREGHGTMNIASAIEESCDVYFYQLAHILNIDRMHDVMVQFGFGSKTGIDIEGERPGLIPSTEWKRRAHNQVWFPGETLNSGIGQGYTLATPLQLAVATAALANRGKRIKPRVAMGAYDPGSSRLTPLVELTSLPPVPVVKPANWESVITAMVNVLHGEHGTARRSGAGAPYLIAGKTGTSQVFGMKQNENYVKEDVALRLRDHGLFISFAPAQDPRIVVAVIVENGSSGSGAAAPLARMMLDQYLIYNDSPGYLAPAKTKTEKLP